MKARFALLATACLATSLAMAEAPAHRAGAYMENIAILLELDDSQKSQVQEILQAQREQMRAQWQEHRKAGTRPTPEEMQQHRQSMKQEISTKLQGVLTPEQMKKYEALMELRAGKRGHRMR